MNGPPSKAGRGSVLMKLNVFPLNCQVLVRDMRTEGVRGPRRGGVGGGGVGVWVSLLFHSPGGEFEQVITLTKFQLVAQLPAHVPLKLSATQPKLFVEKTVGSFFAGLASPAPLSSPVSENARCLVGSFPPSTTPFDYFHSSLSTT